MHISDGIFTETALGTAILGVTTGVTILGTALAVRRLDYEQTPRVAVLAAAFFVASLVHLKIGVTSVHLILNGLVGMILGWAAFPAFVIALLLQAIFFGHGGLTTIGLNACNFAVSALLCYYIFTPGIRRGNGGRAFLLGFLAGSLSLLLAGALFAVQLALIGESFEFLAGVLFLAHVPIALIEGAVTGFAVAFLRRVSPATLEAPLRLRKRKDDEYHSRQS